MHYRGEMRNECPGLRRLQSLRNWDGHTHNQAGSNQCGSGLEKPEKRAMGAAAESGAGGRGKHWGRPWDLRSWKIGRVWKGLGDKGGPFQSWAWGRGLRAGMRGHVPEATGKSVSLERRSVLRIISGDRTEVCRADWNKSWVKYAWGAAGRRTPEYSGKVVMSYIQMARFSQCVLVPATF